MNWPSGTWHDTSKPANKHKLVIWVIKYKAIWITCIAWLLLVTFNQLVRAGTVIPVSATASTYWAVHAFIGLLLGLGVYLLAGIVTTMRTIAGKRKD